jgi:hypothetical protein
MAYDHLLLTSEGKGVHAVDKNDSLENDGSKAKQPLAAILYAVLSFISLFICIAIGWFLVSNPALIGSSTASARGYFVLLAVLGLACAAFLFGAMRSHAQLTGSHFGAAFEFGGPVVVAILVVLGGFHLTKTADDFSLIIRLRTDEAIADASDSWVQVDLAGRRERREFSRSGEASIPNVPSRFVESEIPIHVDSKIYRLKDPKPQYTIPSNGIVYLDALKVTVRNACDGVDISAPANSAPDAAAWCGGTGATRTTRQQAAIDKTPSCISYASKPYADLSQNQLYQEALRLAKAGDLEAAFERIDACQCHNSRTQALLREGKERLICYLRARAG